MKQFFVVIQRLALTKQQPGSSDELENRAAAAYPFPNAIGNLLSHISNLKYESDHKQSLSDFTIPNHDENIIDDESIKLLDFLNIAPNEIVCLMALFLDNRTLAALLRCSSHVNDIVDDDDQFWQMKCESMIFNRKILSSYRNSVASYKKLYEEFIAKKPYYHLKDSLENVFTFLETSDCSILSSFDFGLVYIDPRECVEFAELEDSNSLPIEEQRSIDIVSNNFVKMFTMGIREVGVLVDVSNCNEFNESEYHSKIFPFITGMGKRVGFKAVNLFFINYKTNKGISELTSTIEKSYRPLPSYVQSKPLRGFILDIEKQQPKVGGTDLVAKVAILSGGFNKEMIPEPRIIGDNRYITFNSYYTTPLYCDDIKLTEPLKILRVHINLPNSKFPLKRDESLYIVQETSPPRKTKSFTCQVISLGLEMKKSDFALCVGYSFKILVRIKRFISKIQIVEDSVSLQLVHISIWTIINLNCLKTRLKM
ncbi:predicted protein [Naegleria gruberi]|uniref:Predicted protein n=1 Tax=Naegleria gruberi TaxID=5762 RepID=D2UZ67_NAEGR|nr:uncharacterized protein NAEGRDRAFT_61829 [Naegleria gruberi]EFC49891.1 predicted protein [Naegleria gruberi]|eukprot:XP_002682635.1 predicted protein [Naegleria gruberi strain NEG-M]